jgi:alkylation response protein AidB-like acyl-CoA dehydrogenase
MAPPPRERGSFVRLRPTAEQESLRAALRGYFAAIMTPQVAAELEAEPHGGPCYRRVIKQLGSDGWLGVGWPVDYGGQGRSAMEQYVFYDESQRARVPVPMIALNTVGPTLMASGSAEQKQRYLPRILSGDIDFAIGYSEPGAGTDLAALRTRAVRDGDDWIVSGSKVFTSRGGTADFVWLAARTDPASQGHRGISVFILDTGAPGYSAEEIPTLAGYSTYSTYYDGVRVSGEDLIGTEGDGWQLITLQLNHERIAMAGFGGLALRLYDDVRAWALARPEVRARPEVGVALARCSALLSAMELINLRTAWLIEHDQLTPADASAGKVYGTETVLTVYRLLQEVVGLASTVRGGSVEAELSGDLEWAYRRAVINTFGGGTNEIQRDIIATTGLRMPRAPRRITSPRSPR